MIGLNVFWISIGEPRLLLREHEPVAVVVVPDVLVVQVRIGARERRPLGLVPVIDDQVLPVGILGGHQKDDDVVEDLLDVGAVVGRQPVRDLDQRLRVADFRRVDRAVDEVERAPFLRQPLRLGLGQPARIGQPPVDLDEPVQLRQVLRRADRRQHVRIPHRRLAALLELDAIGRLRQVLEVFDDLGIARELAVGADLDPEVLIGGLWPSGLQQQGNDGSAEKGSQHKTSTGDQEIRRLGDGRFTNRPYN